MENLLLKNFNKNMGNKPEEQEVQTPAPTNPINNDRNRQVYKQSILQGVSKNGN